MNSSELLSRRRRFAARFGGLWPDVAIVVVLLAFALVTRLVLLGDIPPGLHGDEAGFGLESRRIQHEGDIGAWSNVALGTPAGTFYWTAAIFSLFGDTVYTLRVSYALLGVATVPVAYLAFRVMFEKTTATIAGLLFCFSAWHIHFSRVAHVPVAWVLVEAGVMLALFLALRYESILLFALTGAVFAAGIYTYGGYPVFVLAMLAFLGWLAVARYRDRLLEFASWVGVMVGLAIIVGLPMASYALDHPSDYIDRNRERSVARSPEYKSAGNLFERAHVLYSREVDYLQLAVTDPRMDTVDGAGAFPFVSWALVVLLVPGGVICLLRWREPAYAFLLLGIVVIALAPVLTTDAAYRRTVGLTPLLAGVAALPLATLLAWARRRLALTVAAGVVVALAVGTVSAIDLTRYFSTYDDDPGVNEVYAKTMSDVMSYVDTLPGSPYVYFLSGRWSFDHETRKFLQPHLQGEDRSARFGVYSLDADRSKDTLFLFLDAYTDQVDRVEARYPGGRTFVTDEFEAYYLPKLAGTELSSLLGLETRDAALAGKQAVAA